MRRSVMSVALALTFAVGVVNQATAQPRPAGVMPAAAKLPSGWTYSGNQLTWTAGQRVPVGDAAVEFYSGAEFLGRPTPSRDGRSFRLSLDQGAELKDLRVSAGGRALTADGERAPARTGRHRPSERSAPKLPTATLDPGKPGPYRTSTGEYTLNDVALPGMRATIEMKGVVVAPVGATGKRPLALFLHGRHDTCFNPKTGATDWLWPCAEGFRSIPSDRGYLQAQKLLASQGYDTVSISANGINGQDVHGDSGAQARSSLVRLHLGHWAAWSAGRRASAPAVIAKAPRADMSKVLLIGHSRGGEGVNRAAMDSLTPPPADQDGYHGKVAWTIGGTVLIGPTAFGQNPAPDVPSATILPGCDGDVADLQGQMYVDATRGLERGKALHSAIYVEGANHNYFNTEWTPGQAQAPAGDDAGDETDGLCGPSAPGRLTAAQQQDVGATYIATAARLFIAGDDRARPLLDGSTARPTSAAPAIVHTHAVGANRRPVVVPDERTTVTGDGAELCSGVSEQNGCAIEQSDEQWFSPSPHFASFAFFESVGRYAIHAKWSAAGTPITIRPAAAARVKNAEQLALRIIVPPNSTGTTLRVRATTPAGKHTVLGEVKIDGLPGNHANAAYWGQEVRVPLKGFTGSIAALDLVPVSGNGEAWLIDAWTWRPGTPSPSTGSAPPRIDIGSLTVSEGNSGTRTYEVPVKVNGTGSGAYRLFLRDADTGESISRVQSFKPGQAPVTIRFSVTGNTLYGDTMEDQFGVKAVRNSMVGGYIGGLVVRNDDPMPELTFEPVADRVKEGQTLSWRVHASAGSQDGFDFFAEFQSPEAGTELTSTDVDPVWFEGAAWDESPEPSRPLSRTTASLYAFLEPSDVTGEFTIPTVSDAVTEPDRHVQLRVTMMTYDGEMRIGTLTGTVTD
jgi:hypothetical protein